MDIRLLTSFFMWCTIINGSLLIIWTVISALAPELLYRSQKWLFPIPREKFDVVIYSFLGLFKIVFLVFNLVPFIALKLVE